MTAEAKSSVGVRMYLSDGSDPVLVSPSAISKTKPAHVTATPPTGVSESIDLLGFTPGTTTSFNVSQEDLAKLSVGFMVTFAGFVGDANSLNGAKAITALDTVNNTFTIADNSSAMTEASLNGVTATIPRSVSLNGSVALVQESGFPELDGKYFSVANATGTGFDLVGSDTSKSANSAMLTGAKIYIWDGGIMVSLCLSAFAFNSETPGTVSVGTYCDPTASLPAAAVAAGTATFTGYIDVDDPAYPAILQAVEDAKRRVFSIVLPQDQGEIIAPVTFSGITWDIPMGDGGMAFTATAALGSRPVHRF